MNREKLKNELRKHYERRFSDTELGGLMVSYIIAYFMYAAKAVILGMFCGALGGFLIFAYVATISENFSTTCHISIGIGLIYGVFITFIMWPCKDHIIENKIISYNILKLPYSAGFPD